MVMIKKGSGLDDVIEALMAVQDDLLAIKTSYLDHRHKAAGDAAAANTGPSTAAGTHEATEATVSLTMTSD